MASDFLGCDVVGGSPDAFLSLLIREGRQPEVYQLAVALIVEQDVLGLDVAMDKADVVCRGQAAGNLHDDPQNERLAERVFLIDHFIQMPPFDQLHDDVGLALLLPERVDLRDIRVVELRYGLGFALEGFDERCVVTQ